MREKRSYAQEVCVKGAGKAMQQAGMLWPGCRVGVAVSGGVDSFVLLKSLHIRQGIVPFRFELMAIHLNPGFDPQSHAALLPWLARHGIASHLEVTDYGPHRAWIAPRVDAYVVSNEDMLPEMVEMGAPRDIIYPFGIPVDNVFFSKENKAALLQEMGLEPGVPTILFMAGSFGVSGIMDIYREIAAQDIVFQIIVITGKNQKLYEAFAVELAKSKRRTKLIYFTDEVEKYMHAADLLVTKPGGLTVSEALACDIPLAVFDAIPGQEEDNAQFLLSHNMAVRIRAGESCGKTIRIVLADNRRLEDMRSSCERFDKSKSGENILWLIRSLTGKEKAL